MGPGEGRVRVTSDPVAVLRDTQTCRKVTQVQRDEMCHIGSTEQLGKLKEAVFLLAGGQPCI